MAKSKRTKEPANSRSSFWTDWRTYVAGFLIAVVVSVAVMKLAQEYIGWEPPAPIADLLNGLHTYLFGNS